MLRGHVRISFRRLYGLPGGSGGVVVAAAAAVAAVGDEVVEGDWKAEVVGAAGPLVAGGKDL